MLIKHHTSSQKAQIVGRGTKEVLAMHKAASATRDARAHGEITRDADGNVDLVAEIKKHPDALWLRVKAIEADHENDNGDYFSREEILKAYKTFEGVPVFCNHENNKVENAKGKVVLAEWDDQENAVYCTMFVDKVAHPHLCRAIEEGYVTDVSMGTQVDYSTCSVCENMAKTADEYCDHVRTMKGRPVNGHKVFERNYGLKFIEISVVTDGACPSCTIREVIDPAEAVARSRELQKAAASAIKAVKKGMTKDGGVQEIRMLNEAMDLLENVTRKMLDQRQYVDMEFMQKVAEVLSELQHVTDELVDAGYAHVGEQANAPAPGGMAVPPLPEAAQEPGGMAPKPVSTEPTGTGVGSVTEPAMAASDGRSVLSSAISNKIKDLHASAMKLLQEAGDVQAPRGGSEPVNKSEETIKKLAKIWENPSVRSFKTEVSEGDFKIVVGSEEVIGLRGGDKIASLKVASLDGDVREELSRDPRHCAAILLDSLKNKFPGAAPAEKKAEKAPVDHGSQVEQTMEAQLREQKTPLHPRQNDPRESITESQLGDGWPGYEYHKRDDDPRHTITEKQLSEKWDGYEHHDRQGKPREEITELQLRNTAWRGNVTPATSDRQWAAGVDDQKQQITEGQLEDWKGPDKRHLPSHEITEKQLRGQDDPLGRRMASVSSPDEAKQALSAGMRAIVRTSKATGATPEEITAAIDEMTSSPGNEIAATRAAKALDEGKFREARASMLRRSAFGGTNRVASKSDVQDFLLGSLGDAGLAPELGLNTLEALASRKDAAKRMADAILAGAADDDDAPAIVANAREYLRNALAESDEAPADPARESIEVILGPEQVDADPKDVEKFAEKAFEAATRIAEGSKNVKITDRIHVKQAANGDYEVSMYGVLTDGTKQAAKADEKKDAKVASKEPKDEIAERKAARRKLAQMPPGGGMPTPGMEAGGPMGGGGTTMPAPVPADPSMTPPVSSMMDEGAGAADEGDDLGEALPPGSTCAVCGSENVDLHGGEFNCGDCGASGTIKVLIEVDDWPGTIEGDQEGGDEEAAEGIEMPEAPPAPEMGIAATFKVTPEMIRIAGNKPIGSHCPRCASGKVKLASRNGEANGACQTCGNQYQVEVFVDGKQDMWATLSWKDRNGQEKAPKAAGDKSAILREALKRSGVAAKFAKADLKGKAAILADLHDKKLLVAACKCGCGCDGDCGGKCGCKDCDCSKS